MLFAVIILWACWRVALHPRPPGRGARAVLVLGATGLLYAHYFAALLLPALALFHLFFVRKERRWWQPVALLGLAALLALPQVPDLLSGIAHNQEKDLLHAEALRFPEVIAAFLRYLSNGLLEIRRPFSTLFALALPLPLPLFIFGWRSRRNRQPPGAVWYLLLTSILLLLLLLGAIEWLLVFKDKRLRYLATLWPPVLLLISKACMQPSRVNLRRSVGLALVTLMALAGASGFLLEAELVRFSRLRSVPIAATRAIAAEGSANGFLVVGRSLSLVGAGRVYELYTGAYDKRRMLLEAYTTSDELLERADDNDLVWLMSLSSQEKALHLPSHIERFRQDGWFHCRSSREAGVSLELFLAPLSTASGRLQFESAATLLAPDELLLRDGRLLLWAGLRSDDETFLNRHSLAIHIFDSRTGERIAQGDTGIGPGFIVPFRSEIDISALPPGDYEVHIALYDWQTGERLLAQDTETDVVSDIHALHHFRSG